jgi:Acyl-CoA carboxylase epsilon subunit
VNDEPVETPPLLLVKGDATDEEVAALVTVLQGIAASAAAAAEVDQPAEVSAWAAPARKVRVSHPHGPGGWRASGLPR